MLIATKCKTSSVTAGGFMADFTPEQARERLLELQTELESVAATGADSAAIVELDQSKVGRLSRMDAMQAQAMAKASEQRREATLRDITAALQRIDNGDYGICIDCDEGIAAQRLEFDPTVIRCIDCASKREQQ
jgi:DnaK suppressor protein